MCIMSLYVKVRDVKVREHPASIGSEQRTNYFQLDLYSYIWSSNPLLGSIKSQVSFAEYRLLYRLLYRALLQKRPIIFL